MIDILQHSFLLKYQKSVIWGALDPPMPSETFSHYLDLRIHLCPLATVVVLLCQVVGCGVVDDVLLLLFIRQHGLQSVDLLLVPRPEKYFKQVFNSY